MGKVYAINKLGDRPLDILGQFDGDKFSMMLGITPDYRAYRVSKRTHARFSRIFVRLWAFVFVIVMWKEA